MKKEYIAPIMEINSFEADNIIMVSTSSDTQDLVKDNGNEGTDIFK